MPISKENPTKRSNHPPLDRGNFRTEEEHADLKTLLERLRENRESIDAQSQGHGICPRSWPEDNLTPDFYLIHDLLYIRDRLSQFLGFRALRYGLH